MGLAQIIKAHYMDKNRPRFSRQIVLPAVDPGIGVTLTASAAAECTYGAWTDIAAQADVLVDSILCGIVLDTPNDVGALPIVYTIDIGLTYILATNTNYDDCAAIIVAVNAGDITDVQVHRLSVRFEFVTDAGGWGPIMFPFPVWVLSGVGVMGRIKTDSATGELDQINCSILLVQHFERAFE